MPVTRRRILLAAFLLLALPAVGCGRPSIYRETRFALGPVAVEVQLVARNEAEARKAMDAAFDAIARVNRLVSVYVPDSEISQLNRAGGKPVRVSPRTAEVLGRALEASRQTGGAFDMTAGPLIRLWKRAIKTGELPADAELAAARARVGWQSVRVERTPADATGRDPRPDRKPEPSPTATGDTADAPAWTVTLGKDRTVDLGGIAKGFAVDEAVRALRRHGIADALVDAGGDGYAMGTKPDGSPWRIGVQNPRGPSGEILDVVLKLRDTGYATSGDYQQYTEIDGVRYAHIVDPRTGRATQQAASVTILAPDCTTADALATGVCVLGPTEGLKRIGKTKGVEAMIITAKGKRLTVAKSAGFDARAGGE
jgi:thiamine biosynthesis lipoprotein